MDVQTNNTKLFFLISHDEGRLRRSIAVDGEHLERHCLLIRKTWGLGLDVLEVIGKDVFCIRLPVNTDVHNQCVKIPILSDMDEDLSHLIKLLSVVVNGCPLKTSISFDTEFRHKASIRRSMGRFVAVGKATAYLRHNTHEECFMAAEDVGIWFDPANPYERPSFTLGIEEEYMVLDPTSFNLKSHIQLDLLGQGEKLLHEHIKPEMHGSMLEIGTGICKNTTEAFNEVRKIRSVVSSLAAQNGLCIGASSSHPFARWEDQEIYPDERYRILVEDMQVLARSLLIFGMHVHIGIENRETQIQLMNEMRYFMPHILAISTNSPFWEGIDTGLKSYRSKIFERFPRTALPDAFSSWGEYQNYVNLLIKTGSIDNAKKIWWDIRPHPFFPTLEVRICDLPMRIEETIAIAAICQAVAAKLFSLYEKNLSFRTYRRSLLMENKWRAVRYGLDGNLIDWGRQREMPARDLIRELLEFVDDVVDDLGSRQHIEYIHTILENGSGADRQLRVFRETGSMTEVAKYIHEETTRNLL
ncbi:MAG: hypothetical protein RL594_1285 [Bacteroidota bacterium]